MGVFTVDTALGAAAIDAGHELGLFEALESPLTLAQLADRAHLRPTHRLVALVDALVALGALVREGDRIARGSVAPKSAQPMVGGWGAIADVIRRDTALVIDDADIARRYQRHLVTASAPAAREVAEMLVAMRGSSARKTGDGPQLLASETRTRKTDDTSGGETGDGRRLFAIDIGGGAGAYARALLDADSRSHVTLVDMPDVIELARVELADYAERLQFVAADARRLEFGSNADTFDIAIVANVLHLHSPAACGELCASAARAVAPGGMVAIVDLRRGTLEGEMFALNMALYTDGGGVYSVEQISIWLRAAGLVDIEQRLLESAPEMTVVLARRRSV